MNLFAIIILLAILLDYLLDLASNVFNLKALKLNPPAPLQDIYTAEAYRRSQQYTRDNTRLGFVTGTFNLGLLLTFWFSGGFNWLDQAVRAWGLGSIASGLLYTGILALAYSLLTLPFSVYGTFVIEQRYGFNRTTPHTFIVDRMKGLLLGVALGAPLLAGILALFELAGPGAWLYCWAAITLYMLVIEFIAPNWIMPLFNKFTPLEQGELRSAIFNYAGSINFPISNVFVMDGSKRSSKSNAFFTGFGRYKRIALFDTLVAQHTVQELVAVLAHEIGHYKKKHILWGLAISIVHSGILLFLLSLVINSPGLYSAFYVIQPSVYTGLIFFGLLYTPVELILSVLANMLSRRYEYAADRFAAQTIADRGNMVNALKKLSANNLSNLTPHPLYVFMHYTHPPLLQRIQAIQPVDISPAGS